MKKFILGFIANLIAGFSCSLYVSNGVGTSILPIRFNAPPEFLIAALEP